MHLFYINNERGTMTNKKNNKYNPKESKESKEVKKTKHPSVSINQAQMQTIFAGVRLEQSKEVIDASEELCKNQEEILSGNLDTNTSAKKDYLFKQGNKAADVLIQEIQRLNKSINNLKDASEEIQSHAEKLHKKFEKLEKKNK